MVQRGLWRRAASKTSLVLDFFHAVVRGARLDHRSDRWVGSGERQGAVAFARSRAGEIVNPTWSDRQGQFVEGSQSP